jgi:curved DNA-binding protein
MEYKDYYKILGVSRDADQKEIKRAFRRLARTFHPDVNPEDEHAEERFKEINEAYEVLSDPEKRRKYDQLGQEWSRYRQTGGGPEGFDWSQWATQPGGGRGHVQYGTPEDLEDLFGGRSPFSDFFTQIFGGMGGGVDAHPGGARYQPRPRRGQDLEQEVMISLDEAYHGTSRVLEKDGRRLEVQIPPGARTGTRVRMAGEGGPGAAGGAPGDLYLRLNVVSNGRFERRGDDLTVTVDVGLYTALLGGEVEVPTLSGAVLLRIPEGTQNGRTFRLRGQGMPRLGRPEERGDLYAKVNVRLPESLSPRERELFEELRTIAAEGASQGSNGR